MTINEIYAEFTVRSEGFIAAVETHCGLEISRDEIGRIADRADSAEEFMEISENDDTWTDENNAQTTRSTGDGQMNATYHITDENAASTETFTSKRAALKHMAEINRAGHRYNCYVYRGDQRVDNGAYDAEKCIRGWK